MTRATDIQVLSLFAEQIDALLWRVSRQRGDRDRRHANQPLERRMQRLSVPGEGRFHFGNTLSASSAQREGNLSKVANLVRLLKQMITRWWRVTRMTNEEQPDRFLYFGYGSNMLNTRLQARTPSATPYNNGYVAGRRRTFAKTSDDGSGKCDAELTGNAVDRVEGVLFWIDRSEKPALDRAEGLGRGYDETTVDVVTPTGVEPAIAYVASAGVTDSARQPYHWYKALVLAGAIQHGLPAPTIAWVRAVESTDDPLPRRRTKLEAEAALAASGVAID